MGLVSCRTHLWSYISNVSDLVEHPLLDEVELTCDTALRVDVMTLQPCHGPWSLIVQKARLWIDSFCNSEADVIEQKDYLFKIATSHARDMDLPDPTEGPSTSDQAILLEGPAAAQSEALTPPGQPEDELPEVFAAPETVHINQQSSK